MAQQRGFLPVPDNRSRKTYRRGPNGEWIEENPDPRMYAGTQAQQGSDSLSNPWDPPGTNTANPPETPPSTANRGYVDPTWWVNQPPPDAPFPDPPDTLGTVVDPRSQWRLRQTPTPQEGPTPQEEWEKNFAANNPNFNPYLQGSLYGMPNPWDPPGTNTTDPNFPPNTYANAPGEPPKKTTTGGANWYDDGINKHAFMNWINDMSEKGGGRFKPNNEGIRALVKEINTYPKWGHVKVVEGNQKWKHKVDFGGDIGVIDLIGNAASMGGGTWQWLVPGKGAPPPDMSGGLPTLPYAGGEIGPSFSPSDFPTLTLPRAEYAPYATGDPFSYDAFRAPSLEEARNEPGYEFARSEGLRALENAAGARGMTRTGSALKDVVGWGNRFAGQNYGNVYDRAASDYDRNRQNAFNQWGANEQQRLNAYTTSRDTRQGVFDRNVRNLQAEFDPRFEATKLSFADRYRRWKDGLTSFTQLAMMPDPLT
jgi:hypothetical protein